MSDKKELRTLPVTLLKRRKHTNKDIVKQQRERARQIRERAKIRRSQIHKPAYFISASRKRTRDEMRLARVSRMKTPLLLADTPRLGLVLRLKRETEELSEDTLAIFNVLRLDTYNLAVFVKVDQHMLELLNLVAPYIAWGYPSLNTVRDLLLKRGKTFSGGRKKPLDNKIVEEKLGSLGILCLEDVIHELVTCGPNMRNVLQLLCPLKLMPPSRGWLTGVKRCRSTADKRTGMREENINEMVKRMI